MLGTGSAFPSSSYNTCLAIRTDEELWLTDGGGGNGIFSRLKEENIPVNSIHHLFVTHTHTDHIFGAVWLMRSIVQHSLEGKYSGTLNLYGNPSVIHALKTICSLTLLPSYYSRLNDIAIFTEVGPDTSVSVGEAEIRFFDCGSENVNQTGFIMTLPSGKTIACMGDEALTEANERHVAGCDWLFCGAFCRYADRDVFRPYEKHHRTVKDVAALAENTGIKNLALYHSEDRTPNREEAYTEEAALCFSGRIHIPHDGSRYLV